MRRALLCFSLTLLGFASLAHAGAVNLRWNQCWGDGGVVNKNFACDTNVGSHVLVASFVPDAPVFPPQTPFAAVGLESMLDIAVASPVLPAWWDGPKDPGSSRQLASAPRSRPPRPRSTVWTGLRARRSAPS